MTPHAPAASDDDDRNSAETGSADRGPVDEEPWIGDDLTPDTLPSEGFLAADELSPKIPSEQVNDSDGSRPRHAAELFPVPPESSMSAEPAEQQQPGMRPKASANTWPENNPLPLVETAFLASAASLMWLVNLYFPPGPLLRILFPLPIALVYLRWNVRAAWMSALVSGLLLTILLGPTRSILFVMPYGFLGVQLGCLWRRRVSWEVGMLTGGLLVALGTFFRVWLLSVLSGENLWGYIVAQITGLITWGVRLLTNWGWIELGVLGEPSMTVIGIAAVAMVIFASVVYLFTVHLAAWLVLERLKVPMSPPPGWVMALIEEQ